MVRPKAANHRARGQGFVPQPIRWRVEQTYGVLILHRRMVRDYEHHPAPPPPRVHWAMIHVMARRLLRDRGITPKSARKGTAHGSGPGKTRWAVERTSAGLHQFKRLRTRDEIRADLRLGLLRLACSIVCLRRLRTSL